MTREPCVHCGQETAAGSGAFSGRVRVIGHETTYVCPSCLDTSPVRDADGVVLSKERLAALSYTVYHDRTTGG
jgi:hypothetical protein